jgi:hypothetical protein
MKGEALRFGEKNGPRVIQQKLRLLSRGVAAQYRKLSAEPDKFR